MKTAPKLVLAASALALLGACTTIPTGPSVMVLPGSTKNFDQFRADDFDCRNFATAQVNGATNDTTERSQVGAHWRSRLCPRLSAYNC